MPHQDPKLCVGEKEPQGLEADFWEGKQGWGDGNTSTPKLGKECLYTLGVRNRPQPGTQWGWISICPWQKVHHLFQVTRGKILCN